MWVVWQQRRPTSVLCSAPRHRQAPRAVLASPVLTKEATEAQGGGKDLSSITRSLRVRAGVQPGQPGPGAGGGAVCVLSLGRERAGLHCSTAPGFTSHLCCFVAAEPCFTAVPRNTTPGHHSVPSWSLSSGGSRGRHLRLAEAEAVGGQRSYLGCCLAGAASGPWR